MSRPTEEQLLFGLNVNRPRLQNALKHSVDSLLNNYDVRSIFDEDAINHCQDAIGRYERAGRFLDLIKSNDFDAKPKARHELREALAGVKMEHLLVPQVAINPAGPPARKVSLRN